MCLGHCSLIYFLGDEKKVKHLLSGDGVIHNSSGCWIAKGIAQLGEDLSVDPLLDNQKPEGGLVFF